MHIIDVYIVISLGWEISLLSDLEVNYFKLPRKLIKGRETIGRDKIRQGIQVLKVCKYILCTLTSMVHIFKGKKNS